MKVARIYCRVSTADQDLERQHALAEDARNQGYYIAKIYQEKASGATADRPKLNELIEDLQPGEVIIAESIDRISRLPLPEAERLVQRIKDKGAGLAIPGLLDLSEYDLAGQPALAQIVLESVRDMLLKVALQIAREDYELRRKRQLEGIIISKKSGKYKGRTPDYNLHRQIFYLRHGELSLQDIAGRLQCSVSTVKRVLNQYQDVQDIPCK